MENFHNNSIFKGSPEVRRELAFSLIDGQSLLFGCGPVKVYSLKAKLIIMSFIFTTLDFISIKLSHHSTSKLVDRLHFHGVTQDTDESTRMRSPVKNPDRVR